ncbi:hypothetical protein BH09BAC5_BH09BAC5_03110 [soil metagenome]
MKKAGKIFIYVILPLIVLSTVLFFERKTIVRKALPKIDGIEIKDLTISNDTIYVQLLLLLKNGILSTYEIKGINVDISTDEILLLQFSNSNEELVRDSLNQIPINFKLPISKLISQINSHKNQDSTLIGVKGVLDFSTSYGRFNIPFDEYIPIAVPIRPEFTVRQVEYLGKNTKNDLYDFKLKIKVVNTGNKGFHFRNINYNFAGENLIQSNGILSDIVIPPTDSINITIPVGIKLSHKFELLSRIVLDNDVIDYTLVMSGTIVSIGGYTKDIPATFTNKGKVELYKPGANKKIIKRIRHKKKK